MGLPRLFLVRLCWREYEVLAGNQTLPVRWYFKSPNRGLESAMRVIEMSKKFFAQNIKLGLGSSLTFFVPDICKFSKDVLRDSFVYSFICRDIPRRHPQTCQVRLR